MSYEDVVISNQSVADNLGSNEEVKPIIKILNNFVNVIEGPKVIYTRDVSTDSIYGTAIYGTDRYDGTYDNEDVINKVTNYNNRYYEPFTTTTFKDTTNTTATWNQSLVFSSSATQTATSLPVFKNTQNVIYATLDVEGTNTTSAEYYMSANGGTNWEEVSLNTRHKFTNQGTDLRWKTAGQDVSISKLQINYEV